MNKIKLLILVVLMASCINDKVNVAPPSSELVNVGDTLPRFSAESIFNVGKYVNNDSLARKVTMVVLFNTGCSDCQREFPKIEGVWNRFRENPNFKLVAIARQQSREAVITYWTNHNLTMPAYMDPERAIFAKFASSTIPRIYLTANNGVVVQKWIEVIPETYEQFIAIVDNLLDN